MNHSSPVTSYRISSFIVGAGAQTSTNIPKRPLRLQFYLQETFGNGTNATVRVVTSSTLGLINIIRDPLTEGPDRNSTAIGMLYGMASYQTDNGSPSGLPATFIIYVGANLQIMTKEYNGTFSIQGAIDLLQPERYLPITGGTGDFLSAKGYAIQSFATGNAFSNMITIKYDVFFQYVF
jgi:hypothetical protein